MAERRAHVQSLAMLRTTPLLALLLVSASISCGCGGPAGSAPQAHVAAASMQSAPPPTATEAGLHAALSGSARTDSERARDGARHPLETLAFFGVREDASVLELWPGGGYYTTILAPLLASRGRLVVTHFDPNGDPKNWQTKDAQALLGRFTKSPEVFGRVGRQVIATPGVSLGADASFDFVLTFRNVHNWLEEGYAERVFAEIGRVLKRGGVLGVEEHRGRPGMSAKEIEKTGYVPEDVVVALARHAGLELAGRSEVNANPRDTKDYPDGVWSLPPTLAGKDVDRDRFVAIGESDRMTLKFVKP
jgi:predicted methyltransferase